MKISTIVAVRVPRGMTFMRAKRRLPTHSNSSHFIESTKSSRSVANLIVG